MNKIVIILLCIVSVSKPASAFWGWYDDMVSGVQLGFVDNNFGGGFYSHGFIGESFFIPQIVRGTYENNAGIKAAPINFGVIGVGYDFNKLIYDTTSKMEYFHPYILGTFDMTFLFTNAANDSDVGFGYTGVAGANYRFGRFVLGAEFNHNFVNYLNYASHHSQNYLLTLGASFY
jgi:hypothetical protein